MFESNKSKDVAMESAKLLFKKIFNWKYYYVGKRVMEKS